MNKKENFGTLLVIVHVLGTPFLYMPMYLLA